MPSSFFFFLILKTPVFKILSLMIKASLELVMIPLSQPFKCWDVSGHLSLYFVFTHGMPSLSGFYSQKLVSQSRHCFMWEISDFLTDFILHLWSCSPEQACFLEQMSVPLFLISSLFNLQLPCIKHDFPSLDTLLDREHCRYLVFVCVGESGVDQPKTFSEALLKR